MIYIRADANQNIGMGHIMRCLSIADCLICAGHQVIFILADDSVTALVQSRGYEVIVLESNYIDMEKELSLWPKDNVDIIIVDSYYVTDGYFKGLKQKTDKLVYIDDLATFPYPVDILVNYNVYGAEIDYHRLYNESGVEVPYLILGPTYAPLRSMFMGVEKKVQREKIEDVLISTGGADEFHLALRLVLDIVKRKKLNYKYHILLGAMNQDRKEIEALVADNDYIILHKNVSNMRLLICKMDIIVSAAGSTLYEICACGVPMIMYSSANNQILGAETFEKLNLAVNIGDLRMPNSSNTELTILGDLRADAVDLILAEIDKLADDYERRCKVGNRMQEFVDGFGADRMIQKIMNIDVQNL